MLATLRIKNLALIDELELDFTRGFNVLTGETGAGKSVLVGALSLVLGARATAELVREGARRATVEAVFAVSPPSPALETLLRDNDIDLEGGELLLSRTIGADGRSRAYAGGRLVPLGVLGDIGSELVDLHGQHEHQSLLRADRQRDCLDAFAGAEDEAAAVANAVGRLRAIEAELAELEQDDRERARRVDFLRYAISEIDQAGLAPGEEDELRARRSLIANAERIYTLAGEAYRSLYDDDDGAAIDRVGRALLSTEELAKIDGQFQPLAEQLAGVRAGLEAVAAEVRGYTEAVDYDEDELNAINARLSAIAALKRKYGDSVEAILAYRDEAHHEVDKFDRRDEQLARLAAERDRLHGEAMAAAEVLSRKRQSAAKKLDKHVTATLQQLGMKGARFETRIDRKALSANGIDDVAFQLGANVGERLKPMKLVASGGEISRTMLAIKSAFAKADRMPTLIFDEIDAGVGGTVAGMVAQKIAELANYHQVLCITHLPQLAAAAETHFHVAKATDRKRTTTRVLRVDAEQRVAEVARLLDGSVSDVSLQHARALLTVAE